MKLVPVFILLIILGCSATKKQVLTDIHLMQGVIYCQHSEINKDTRHYYVKSEACTGIGGQLLVQAIWSIPGVSNVYPSPYKLTVAICPVYSWDDIEPEILSRINKLLEAYELDKGLEPEVDKSGGL